MAVLAQQVARPPAPAAKAGKAGKAVKKADAPAEVPAPPGTDISLGLRLGPRRPVRMTPDEESTLPNGLRVTVSENREIPQVNMFMIVPAGSVNDPAGQIGLAEVTAAAVRTGGSASLTAVELQEKLGQLGATIEAGVSESRAQFALNVPTSAFGAAAPILRDLLLAPRLDPEAVDTTLAQLHESIGQRNQNPVNGLTRLFRRRLYDPASPWGRAPEYDTLDNVARSDIESFHRQYYAPSKAVLVIEGDIAATDVKAKAEELFGAWKAPANPAAAKAIEPPKPSGSALLFADRDDLRLTGFVLGHVGGRISDSDYAAMLLVCDVLATGAEARLPSRVRAAGGWRADWSATWDGGYDRPGEFAVRATLDPPFTTQSVAIAKDEISKLREGGITDKEVELARTRMLTRMALRAQSSADQAIDRGLARFYGLPPDQLARTFESLSNLTKADVARAAARNLLPEQIVVVAGNSRLFDRQLTTIAPKVEPVELSVQAARPLKQRTDPASLERGRQALSKMQEAMGGQAKLAAIRDLSIRLEGTTLVGDKMSNIKLWDRWMAGDVYRQDQEFGPMAQTIFYNGKIAWIGRWGSIAPLPPVGVTMVRTELFCFPFRLAVSDQNPARQIADLGGSVLQITEGDAYGVRIYIDAATGLPQRLTYRTDMGNGNSVAEEQALSEWKDFEGIKFPTKISTRKNGRKSDELRVVEVKVNSELKLADLEKKP
jgi:zinc protease